jgi:hypothetical protein
VPLSSLDLALCISWKLIHQRLENIHLSHHFSHRKKSKKTSFSSIVSFISSVVNICELAAILFRSIMGGFISRNRRREDKEKDSPRLESFEAEPNQNE